MDSFHNVFLFPIAKDYEEGAALNQLTEADHFLNTV